jgi:hypothetical protein
VVWKPRLRSAGLVARPSRFIISQPHSIAASSSAPVLPCHSTTAIAADTTGGPWWSRARSSTSSSSMECSDTASAKAACTAGTLSPRPTPAALPESDQAVGDDRAGVGAAAGQRDTEASFDKVGFVRPEWAMVAVIIAGHSDHPQTVATTLAYREGVPKSQDRAAHPGSLTAKAGTPDARQEQLRVERPAA